MSYIILIRMNNDDLWTIEEDPEENRVMEWETYEEAEKWLDKSSLKTQGWDIIEVEI